ncbi:MAG: TRAP transporter fused permease subunit [Rhodospirillales bacterium]|nr:MAG: TRAP transporter fused permease subunit [Rhodospirillales bacterium]
MTAAGFWPPNATVVTAICGFVMTLACVLWNLDVPLRLGFAILTEQYLALQLGLAICIVFLGSRFTRAETDQPGLVNWLIAIVGLVTLLYTAVSYVDLLREQPFRPPALTFIGAVVVLCVLEGIRRRAGKALFIIVAAFIVYALFAHRMPGVLVGREMKPVVLLQYIGFDPSAGFSLPLTVASVIVILFVFFGKLLFVAGGGAFFTDLAMALTGRTRGGSAKISVVASALFGSISGSAVSNVVTTGVITIPLMRKGGYSSRDAGAIEAIASTGGQLTPPIMGAAAFLMAEFLEISYTTVAIAALIPAALYYFSVFLQVDLIAARDRIAVAGADGRGATQVLREGWHLGLPFVILLIALFWFQIDPAKAALLSALAIVVVGSVRPYQGQRISVMQIIEAFSETGRSLVDLILIVTAAGFVIGILNATGLGFGLTLLLVDSVGGNLAVILLVAAVICILLGMGMPTSGVYVLLAVLIAPSMVEAGVTPLAAHMFILYFGMMSMITPPVALAAFAAAAITRASPMETGVAAMRIGWAAYVIPFAFVSTPALLLHGSAAEVARVLVQTGVCVFAVSVAVVGYFSGRMGWPARALLGATGLAGMPLFSGTGLLETISFVLAGAAFAGLAALYMQARRKAAV